MFWVSAYFWIAFFILLIVTILALGVISSIRRKRLEQSLRLEIINQGNARSRYQIRAEEASFSTEGALEYHFMKNGARLPELAQPDTAGESQAAENSQPQMAVQPSQPEQASSGSSDRIGQAAGLGSTISSLLMSIGRLVGGSFGSTVSQAGSQLNRGQYKVQQAQSITNQAKGLSATVQPARAQSAGAVPTAVPAQAVSGIRWCETPPLQPGETMTVDLLIRSPWVHAPQNRLIRLVSRSIEAGDAAPVVEEGTVQIRGGFWAHHVYPRLLVISTALFLLIMVAMVISG